MVAKYWSSLYNFWLAVPVQYQINLNINMPAFGFMTMYICIARSVYCVAFGCTLYINTMKTTFNFNFDFYGWIELSYQLEQFLFNYLNTLFRFKLVNNQTKKKIFHLHCIDIIANHTKIKKYLALSFYLLSGTGQRLYSCF